MPTTATYPAEKPPAEVLPHIWKVNSTKPLTWESFRRKYLHREDGYKYEWVNASVQKTKRSTGKTQLYILRNLLDFLAKIKPNGKLHGQLISEPDLFFLTNHRRPDIAWLTDEQIDRLAEENAYEIPQFVIEVISNNDQINRLKEKMLNYRDAGVKVVWHIFPQIQQVDVYYGEKLEQMTVCSGDKFCSAASVLPGFELPASDIFRRMER